MCGYTLWRDNPRLPHAQHLADSEIDEIVTSASNSRFEQSNKNPSPASDVATVFDAVGRPISIDDLVSVIARIWNIDETAIESLDQSDNNSMQAHRDEPPVDDTYEQVADRILLGEIWRELIDLPRNQRVAILLNLRDNTGRNAIELLPCLGIASITKIAQVLELSPADLAGMWNGLPLNDRAIAEYLGVSRDQVIGLRSAGKRKIARRLQLFEKRMK
jgi:hypothetical protein